MMGDFTLSTRRDNAGRRPWHGAAFIMEALLLLAFIVASLAVLMQLFGVAHERSASASELSNAVVLASNEAEVFAAAPSDTDATHYFTLVDDELVETNAADTQAENNDAFTVTRTVERKSESAGALYSAHISVERSDAVLYELDTARYVSTSGTKGGVA